MRSLRPTLQEMDDQVFNGVVHWGYGLVCESRAYLGLYIGIFSVRVGDVEAPHGEAVDLDSAQARFADFKPASSECAERKSTHGNRRHACRRQAIG